MVYLFLVVFQPFGTYNFYNPFKYLLLAPYALISFLVLCTGELLLRRRKANWRIVHEALKVAVALLVCTLLSYCYCAICINKTSLSATGMLYMLLFNIALGTPISIMYLLGRYVYLRHSETMVQTSLTLDNASDAPTANDITIRPQSGDPLTIATNDFLLGEAEGNYCNIFYLDKGIVKKQLFRMPLKQLEEQAGSAAIVRCHRSYIINSSRIIRAKGNAQGYQLALDQVAFIVPVSRSYVTSLQKHVGTLCSS